MWTAAYHNWPISPTVSSCREQNNNLEWCVYTLQNHLFPWSVWLLPHRMARHATWHELRHSTWRELRHSLGSRTGMRWIGQSQHFQVFSKPTICVNLHPTPFVQMWHHVTWYRDTNALEETANSTLKVKVPVLKTEATNSSKMLVIYLQDDWKS
jgi:hypothetical protein